MNSSVPLATRSEGSISESVEGWVLMGKARSQMLRPKGVSGAVGGSSFSGLGLGIQIRGLEFVWGSFDSGFKVEISSEKW